MNLVEDNFEDAKIEYCVLCYTDIEGTPYQYSGWVPLEAASKYYNDCLKEDWTKQAKLVKRECYYFILENIMV
jgi:hypothetical protein